MNTKTGPFLIVGLCVTLSGCDQEARDFAANTIKILQARSKDIGTKIKAENDAYTRFSAAAAQDHRDLLDSAIRNEINERSITLAASYHDDPKLIAQWRKDMAAFGDVDFNLQSQLFNGDLDESAKYLQNFQSLKIEQDKVDALAKLLGVLAKKQSAIAELKALGEFAEDSKQQFDTKVCLQIKTDQASTDAKKKAAADAAYKAKGCDPVLTAAKAVCNKIKTSQASTDPKTKASADADFKTLSCEAVLK